MSNNSVPVMVEVKGFGTKWLLDGKLHRVNGPAVLHESGDKEWHLNGKLHREDGPAIERLSGIKSWYVEGKLHREDGPAIEYPDGDKSWYWQDQKLACSTQAEFLKKRDELIPDVSQQEEIDKDKEELLKNIYNHSVKLLEALNVMIPKIDSTNPKISEILLKDVASNAYELATFLVINSEELTGVSPTANDDEDNAGYFPMGM